MELREEGGEDKTVHVAVTIHSVHGITNCVTKSWECVIGISVKASNNNNNKSSATAA